MPRLLSRHFYTLSLFEVRPELVQVNERVRICTTEECIVLSDIYCTNYSFYSSVLALKCI